jgi:hypothetical protein
LALYVTIYLSLATYGIEAFLSMANITAYFFWFQAECAVKWKRKLWMCTVINEWGGVNLDILNKMTYGNV